MYRAIPQTGIRSRSRRSTASSRRPGQGGVNSAAGSSPSPVTGEANSSRRRVQGSLNRNHRAARGLVIKTRSYPKTGRNRPRDTRPRYYWVALWASWPIWLSVLERASATMSGCCLFFVRHDRTSPACVQEANLLQRPKRSTAGLPRLQPRLRESSCISPVVLLHSRRNSNWRQNCRSCRRCLYRFRNTSRGTIRNTSDLAVIVYLHSLGV